MKRLCKKSMALFLTTAMLMTNIGMLTAFASGEDKQSESEKTEQVAMPTADPAAGTYDKAQQVTLKSTTKDAEIYYTLDGKAPTVKSAKFSEKKPIEVDETVTIKAIAVKKDMDDSKVAAFTYTIKADEKADVEDTEESKGEEPANEEPQTTPEPEKEPQPEATQAPSEEGEAQLTTPKEHAGEGTPSDSTPAATDASGTTDTPGTIDPSLKNIATADIAVELKVKDSLEDLEKPDIYKATQEGAGFTVTDAVWTDAASGTAITAGGKYTVKLTLKAVEGYQFSNTTDISLNGVKGTADGEAAENMTERVYQFEMIAPEAAPTIDPDPTAGKVDEGTEAKLKYEGADKDSVKLMYRAGAETTWTEYDASKKITLSAEETATVVVKAVLSGISSEEKIFTYAFNTPDPTDTPEPTETPTGTPKPTDTPEPVIKKISSVEVTGLEKPSRGKSPDRKASATSGSHATVKSVEWVQDGSNNDMSGVFKAGTIYYAYIHLKAKDGYEFDTSAFKAGTTTANAKVSNYSHKPGVKSIDSKNLAIYVAWKTQAAATAAATGNAITGINSSYSKGATITFTMNGAGANNPKEEGNERYVPVKYKVGSTENAITENTPSVTKAIRISTAGTYTLTVTFQKQVYDASTDSWKNVDGSTDTKTATIKVNSTSSVTGRTTGTTTGKPSISSTDSTTKKSSNAKTGDETPVGAMVTIFVLAGAAVVVLAVRKKKSKK